MKSLQHALIVASLNPLIFCLVYASDEAMLDLLCWVITPSHCKRSFTPLEAAQSSHVMMIGRRS